MSTTCPISISTNGISDICSEHKKCNDAIPEVARIAQKFSTVLVHPNAKLTPWIHEVYLDREATYCDIFKIKR